MTSIVKLPKRYRFRKVYFQCYNKQVMAEGIQIATAFRTSQQAANQFRDIQGRDHYMWEDKTKPLPLKTVEGFYLVPEALFDEVLKKYTDQ